MIKIMQNNIMVFLHFMLVHSLFNFLPRSFSVAALQLAFIFRILTQRSVAASQLGHTGLVRHDTTLWFCLVALKIMRFTNTTCIESIVSSENRATRSTKC